MKSLAEALGVPPPEGADREPASAGSTGEKLTAKGFCRELLSSPEYRRSLYNRIQLGELPPAVELMIWDRAHGKTVEKVRITTPAHDPLDALSAEQLRERLAERMAALQSLMSLLDVPSEPLSERDEGRDDTVH